MSIFKKPWTLKFISICFLLISLVIMAAIMLAIGSWGWHQIALSSATKIANNNAKITELKLENLIEPAAAAIKLMAEYPINNKNLGPNFEYLPILIHELQSNELVSAVYIGFSNSDFIAVRSLQDQEYRNYINAPTTANYLLQVIHHDKFNKRAAHFYFYDHKQQLIQTRLEPNFDLNPKDRPWYKSAINKSSLNISEPYKFFSTHQIGLTISKQNTNQQSVISMDIALEDLDSLLDSIKITPNTELAIVSNNGALIGYKNLAQSLSDQYGNKNLENFLPNIKNLNNNPLNQAYLNNGLALKQFDINGESWLGLINSVGKSIPMQLVIAIPMQELLKEAYKNIKLMLLLAVLIIFLSIIWSWWAGGKLSKYLENLVIQAKAMTSFDFTKLNKKNIHIQEVQDLQLAANKVSKTVDSILSISRILGTESDIDTMLDKVLVLTVNATHCLSGAVYICGKEQSHLYKSADYGDYDYPKSWSEQINTKHHYAFKLKDRYQQLQGILILETDPAKQDVFGAEFHAFTNKLTGMLEVTIETRQLITAQKDLFHGMIHMLADAIDAKSPYTGGHCKRVPQLAIMMIENMQACKTGKYADFSLNEQELSEFSIAAWLHDCGKITIPQDIVDKASKLEMIYNRIHEIRMRFEVLWRDAEITYLKESANPERKEQARLNHRQAQQKLIEDYEFVAKCNIGSEFLDDESISKLQEIGAISWSRNFNDLLGLAEHELKQRSLGRTANQELPVTEKLLSDQKFHQLAWHQNDLISQLNLAYPGINLDIQQPSLKQNAGELHNLTIRKGTLTEEDRYIIQNHMVQTLLMLHKLPWPRGYKNVRDIASNHHERMDGNGYPRKIKAGDLPISHRVLAIADVFEALTASDRPYKTTKTVSESLNIMAKMCLENHLDTDLFIYFVTNKIWLKYGNKFLKPEQIDAIDIAQILNIVGAVDEI